MSSRKYIKAEIRLPTKTMDYLFEVAILSGVKFDDVVAVALALTIVKEKIFTKESP